MARNDFNGDGRSDILWLLQGNLAVSNWLASSSGGFIVNDANAFIQLNAFHTVDEIATGDFNGDGRTDVLWLFDHAWYYPAISSATGGSALFGHLDNAFEAVAGWKVVGTGDFNGDGIDDLVWRNADGRLSDWLGTQSGAFKINDANAMVQVDPSWQVIGTGDFNGDGRDDLLWRNQDGRISNWLGTASGGFVVNDQHALANLDEWLPVKEIGIGDFNKDGLDDLFVLTPQGEVFLSVTYPGGAFYLGWSLGSAGSVPQGWHLAATGDYNADGVGDILWRDGSGGLAEWLGTGGENYHTMPTVALAAVSTDWQVASGGVFV